MSTVSWPLAPLVAVVTTNKRSSGKQLLAHDDQHARRTFRRQLVHSDTACRLECGLFIAWCPQLACGATWSHFHTAGPTRRGNVRSYGVRLYAGGQYACTLRSLLRGRVTKTQAWSVRATLWRWAESRPNLPSPC